MPDDTADQESTPPLTTLLAATLSITLGALPVFLLGALAVFIRDELDFGEVRLGAVASLYYLSSALMSIPGGRLAQRLGARRAIAAAALGTAVAMTGIALFASSWARLATFMVLAGIANGIALPATNLALARGIPRARQGTAFGLKQSSGPFATLLAGAAVPALGVTVGWRWAFAFAGLATLPLIAAGRRRADATGSEAGPPEGVPTGPLSLLSFGAASAVVAGSSLGSFYVESAVAGGLSPGAAGGLLAAGSVAGIVARIGWGWAGDHRERGHLGMVAGLLVCGAAGFALLGTTSTVLLVLATVIVFSTGWAWPALFNFAVVRRNPLAPAVASGITATGQFAGGIVGPLGFGALVERTSYQLAWLVAASTMVVAGVLVFAGTAWLDRVQRPFLPPGETTVLPAD